MILFKKTLTENRKGFISLVVLLILVFLVAAGVLLTMLKVMARYDNELIKDARLLAQYRSIELSSENIEDARSLFEANDVDMWAYSADRSVGDVQLAVQRLVSDVVSSQNVQVITVSPVAPVRQDSLVSVGVQLQFDGPLNHALQAVKALEEAAPLLFVTQFTLLPTNSRTAKRDQVASQLVNVQLTVMTAFEPAGESQ